MAFAITIATVESVIKNSFDYNLNMLDFKKFILGSKSILTNGLQEGGSYYGKVKAPEKVLEEIKISYLHSIVQKIEQLLHKK